MKAATLLAVDDMPANLSVLERLISHFLPDCKVVTATTARDGLRIAADEPIDAVLADMQMPEMNGLVMCMRLKRNPATAHIPVMLVTGHATTPELRAQMLDAGADDFVSKPYDTVELAARIRVLLRIKETEDKLRAATEHLEAVVERRTRALSESEARFRTLVEQIPAVSYVASADDKQLIAYISPQVWAILGYATEAFRSNPKLWVEQIHPDDRAEALAQAAESIKTGRPYIRDYRMLAQNGREVWVRDEGVPVHGPKGPVCIEGIVLNVTQQKQAEAALQREQRKTAQYLDAAGVILLALDSDLRVTLVNQRGCTVLGSPRESIVGENWVEQFVPDECREQMRVRLAGLFADGAKPVRGHCSPVVCASGRAHALRWSYTPLHEGAGPAYAILATGEDVAESSAPEPKDADRRV